MARHGTQRRSGSHCLSGPVASAAMRHSPSSPLPPCLARRARRLRLAGRRLPDARDRGRHGLRPASSARSTPAFEAEGRPRRRAATIFTSAGCVGCHTLAAANATGTVGPNLDQAKPDYRARDRAGHARQGRDAVVQGPADRPADRRRRLLRRRSRPAARRRRAPAPAFPRARRRLRGRPRPHADRGGRRAAAAHARRDRARRGPRHARDRRHRPDVPRGPAVPRARQGSTIRSSATRAPSSPTR